MQIEDWRGSSISRFTATDIRQRIIPCKKTLDYDSRERWDLDLLQALKFFRWAYTNLEEGPVKISHPVDPKMNHYEPFYVR